MYASVPTGCLVLVCDGSKAVFYKNVGTALAISLSAISSLEEHHAPTRELGTDRPGRTVNPANGSRSAVEGTDWHQRAETEFIARVAARLEQLLPDHPTTSLILIAPQRALGILRDRMQGAAKGITSLEIAKDLVKTPKPQLEDYLQSLGRSV